MCWDIKAFYESLYLYQETSQESSFFAKKLTQDDIDEIAEFASSDEIIKMGGIKSSQILCYDEFSKVGLLSTLSKLEEKIKESHYQEPVCFILGCLSKNGAHAINVNYDPSDDAWQWMDINLPLQKPFKLYPLNAGSSHEAFWEDLSYFKRYDYFSISAILPKKTPQS